MTPSVEYIAAPARLSLIRRLDLAGQLADVDLDGIVATVADRCQVPVAVVDVVTPDRQTYVAEHGLGMPSTTVRDELSFCAEVVRTGRPLAVSDARSHPVYADNPFVVDGAVVSYAGQPLRVGGRVVGALSVFDAVPRTFSATQLGLLHAQARLVEAVLQLRAAESCDLLTGLSTRAVLLARLADDLSRAATGGQPAGMLVVEVTGMADVNEQHGSDVGDALLRTLADRLTAACDADDLCARTGGDTLAVVWHGLRSTEDAASRMSLVATALQKTILLADLELDPAVRLGLAVAVAGSADDLLATAVRAADGRRDPAGSPRVGELSLTELTTAIRKDQLVVHYQPVVDVVTGRTTCVEALVRWQHPDGRLVPPLEFVPLAEASGLIAQLGDWVLRAAGAQAATWETEGRALDVAVNLSPLQVSRPDFAEHLLSTLREVGAPLERIVLEITESALLDADEAVESLWAVRAAGVRLALDDFGTGYASFSYLRRFPIDVVKIDRSFVAGLGQHPDDAAIVSSIVSLSRRTGKVVIAEGVETRAQAEALRNLGVTLAQGYLWAPALPEHALSAWLGAPGQRDARALDVPDRAPRHVPTPAHATAEARIHEMAAAGASLHTIAAALNGTGSRTLRGTRWHTSSVAHVLATTSSDRVPA